MRTQNDKVVENDTVQSIRDKRGGVDFEHCLEVLGYDLVVHHLRELELACEDAKLRQREWEREGHVRPCEHAG